MSTSNNMRDSSKTGTENFRDWVFRYSKIIMPVVLVICVAVTVMIAVNANKRKTSEEESVETSEETEATQDAKPNVAQVPLEQDAVPEINEMFSTYYNAVIEGDTATMERLVDHLDATEILRAQETSKYIESYPTLEVYTKTGPKEGTYIAYVYTEVKFHDYEKPIPGMSTYYVCTDENGEFYLNQDGEEEDDVISYIRDLSLQDDVIDLSNRAAVAYNDMLAEDDTMADFILDLNSEIEKNVGEALARESGSETPEGGSETAEGGESAETGQDQAQSEDSSTVVTKVKATDVVNIRTSDSETADKLGKAAVGDEFTLLEKKGNGWSKILYEGKDAYIKSEFLEPSETKQADAGNEAGETQPETPDTQSTQQESTASASTGTVTVVDSVCVRASASENGEKLGTAYVGEKLELLMKQADGWTKVKYNGKTAYVKSDYVE